MTKDATANVYKAFVIPLIARFEAAMKNPAKRADTITKFKAEMTSFAAELAQSAPSAEFMTKVKTATQLAPGMDETNYAERLKQIKDTLGLT